MIAADIDTDLPLRLQAADGLTTLFSRFVIRDIDGDVVETLDGDHIDGGLYSAVWTPDTLGRYIAVGQLFLDVGRTIDAGYERVAEDIDVSDSKQKLVRILGLNRENSVLDSATYNPQGRVVAARLRVYDSKANALAATTDGLLATYSISATYAGVQLLTYTQTLEP